ncbi:phosphonate ABC transporter periplasmic binding subunit [Oleiphilus messinensis]|uniref:Phosphonate ABC transporter periplasmic binding subunit n=1 Tax=Oleiphilus messinensis TaxID=141451 RepID=A0A1Y0IJ56_9GAMM|nr:phosphonate ABC transporter substrate-binding protein [Oleiphilus messinensis]ARU59424.1 phosphonate ABC transporter periplasmic binding subunit [Oleiphilus messinensis]
MFIKIFKRLALVFVALSSIATVSAEEMKKLNFGIISTESSQNLRTIWEPFLKDMSEKLNVEVKPFFASDYAGIIQAMRFDKVDLAWYGNKSAMEAVDRAGGEIFMQTVDVAGNPGYWGLLIAHKDSKLNNLDDIFSNSRDLVFGNGDPNSTSGFLIPSYYVFALNNVDAKKAFKRSLNSSHEANALAVYNKQVDFATNNTENMTRFKVTHPDKAKDVKVIWKSPLIPSDPIVWRKNLPESVKSKLWGFFREYGTDGDKTELKILADLGWAPFRPSSDDQLLPIRQLVLYKKKLKLENNTDMDADQKAKEIAEINEQLANLERKLAAIEVRNDTAATN